MTTISRKCIVVRPIVELIEEIKAKLSLLEGDRTAYYETSYQEMKTNKEKIGTLRKEVHDLRLKYNERINKNDAIISQAFQNRPIEKSAFLAKTSETAVEEFDFRVSAAMKRFNYSKYVTACKEERLQELQTELVQVHKDMDCDHDSVLRAQNGQRIRDLENRVDKLELKGNECEFIQKTYEAIFKRLYDEHTRCNNTLDDMESDIVRCRMENAKLRQTHKHAESLRISTERDLRQHEQFELADRKRRDIESARMRKVVEEEKNRIHERGDKSKALTCTDDMDESGEDDFSLDITSQFEEKRAVDTELLEESLERLRMITGMAKLSDMVKKVESQLLVKEKLVDQINMMEKKIHELRVDCSKKQDRLTALKSNMDSTSTGVQAEIEAKNEEVIEVSKHNDEMTVKHDEVSSFFAESKAGLEALMEKLTHVKLANKPAVMKPGSPEEYMMELFDMIRRKAAVLKEELKGHDIASFEKKMLTEEEIMLYNKDEIVEQWKEKLPHNNNRISMFETNSDEEIDSGPDDPSFKNRMAMKHDSTQYIEMRLKKRARKRKHKK